MGVPVVYRKNVESPVASYDFFDLSTGTGYKTFYGSQVVEVSTTKYVLVQETLSANNPYTTSASNTALDLDFDMVVNVPLKLQGNAIVSIPIATTLAGARPQTPDVTIKIYKLDALGVETQIGQTTTISKTYTTDVTEQKMDCAKIAIPFTIIPKGGTLRVSIYTPALGANNTTTISHSPDNQGTSATLISNLFTINLPIKLDN